MEPKMNQANATLKAHREPLPASASPKGIIFDCDGVVVDSCRLSRFVYNYLRGQLGLPPMTREQENFVFAQTAAESLKKVIPPAYRSWAAKAKDGIKPATYLPLVAPQQGILDFLQNLKFLGLKVALNTNGGERAHVILKAFKIYEFFSPVITADDVSQPKPHPEGLLNILQEWNLDAGEVVFIGDSSLDQKAAQAAGVTFWAYRNRSLPAQRHLDDFRQASDFI